MMKKLKRGKRIFFPFFFFFFFLVNEKDNPEKGFFIFFFVGDDEYPGDVVGCVPFLLVYEGGNEVYFFF